MKKLLLLIIFLFQYCSYENPYTIRLKADYFPLDKQGNFWIYKNKDGIEKYLQATGTETKDGKEAFVVTENYEKTYWYKGEGFLKYYKNLELNFNGELVTLEARWQNYIEIPLIKRNSWCDEWQDTLMLFNEPLYINDKLNGTVENIETVTTEAGTFNNCYRITFHIIEEINSAIIGDSIIDKSYSEWYAPNIGLVKSTLDGDNWQLTKYGNDGAGE